MQKRTLDRSTGCLTLYIAIYEWYCNQPTAFFEADEGRTTVKPDRHQRQSQSQTPPQPDAPPMQNGEYRISMLESTANAQHCRNSIEDEIGTNRHRHSALRSTVASLPGHRQSPTTSQKACVPNLEIVTTQDRCIGSSPKGIPPECSGTNSLSKLSHRAALQELDEHICEAETRALSRISHGDHERRHSTYVEQGEQATTPLEAPAPTELSHSVLPPKGPEDLVQTPQIIHHTPQNIDQTSPHSPNGDQVPFRTGTEQTLRRLLRETCVENVNNDCAWTGSVFCRAPYCGRSHICRTWWLGVKGGSLNACPHG